MGLVADQRQVQKFKLSIEVMLDSRYDFKKLKPTDLRQLQLFIAKTIGRQLTVAQVETLYLRTNGGAKHHEQFDQGWYEMLHFSNGARDFRIHGFYNVDGYLVLTRIDPHHQYKF